jgi:hypothetical protein
VTTVAEGFNCPLHVYEIVLDAIMEVMEDTTNVYYQDVHI